MMIDAREQIKNALETICDNVKMSKPAGDVEFPLICYACISNDTINIAYDRLRWRVTAYCNTFTDLIGLVASIDGVMNGELGYTRTYETPDDEAKKGTDFYMKRLDYSAMVNKEHYTVIRGSV